MNLSVVITTRNEAENIANCIHAFDGFRDEVEVILKASMGMKAVYLAYLIPLVVLLAVILGLIGLGVGEVPAGLSGMAAVGVYYLLLWLFRGKLQNEYIFTIKG